MTPDFAILAPVPRIHLEHAPGVAALTGYVSFGSDKWEVFRDVDSRRNGEPVRVLVYASHNEDLAEWGYVVAWQGLYIGSVEDYSAKRADEQSGHRPPSTHTTGSPTDRASGWALFWRVRDLIELPESERRELRHLQSYRTGKDREVSAPRGPEIIKRPPWV